MDQSLLPVATGENRCLPNPRRCPCYSRHTAVERNVWCQNYDRCLDLAVEQQWEGFTCSHCDAFQAITMTSEWLAQEADRCRALAYTLVRDDLRGKHFRKLTQYFRMERAEFTVDSV